MDKKGLLLLVFGAIISMEWAVLGAQEIVSPSDENQETWYYITSSASGSASYCTGSVIYVSKDESGVTLRWGGRSRDAYALWKFVSASDDGAYYLVNKATGFYLNARTVSGSSGAVTAKKALSVATKVYISAQSGAENSYTLAASGGNPIHAQENGGVIVTWNDWSAGSASSWAFEAVDSEELEAIELKMESDESGYVLVWSDEFEETSAPSSLDWAYETGFVRNNEEQWYQSDNASVEGGYLKIEAREESFANPNYEAGSSSWKTSREEVSYTSASIHTCGKHAFTYGRVEVRAKIPTGSGLWPAIWMLGYEGSGDYHWPHSGEIDILEYYNERIWANFCWGGAAEWTGNWNARFTELSYWTDDSAVWPNLFHTWRLDWDEESMKIYLDDELLNAINLENTYNSYGTASGSNPFRDTPAYLLLNLALGGDNGGEIDTNLLPATYYVDYVRVYQKPGQWHEERGSYYQTGISKAESANEVGENLRLRRNSSGEWWIQTTAQEGGGEALVFDLSGGLVSRKSFSSSASAFLELNALEKGVYIVELRQGEQRVGTKIVR